MQKYKALITYAGTHYCGWQRQKGSAAKGSPSIQATLEDALAKMTGETCSVVGSGRTDSGVHAAGQVAHFVLKKKDWPPEILQRGLNSQLPTDIRVIGIERVDLEFHAQRSALKKQYSYYFQQGPCALPHLEPYSWWIKKKLDHKAMQVALNYLKGEHDFKSFQSSGAKPGPTVRKILEARIEVQTIAFPGGITGEHHPETEWVRVRLVGTGFLKQMVRGIAGTLLQIGEGRREAIDMKIILDKKDRSLVGPTAPGRALWLEKVWY